MSSQGNYSPDLPRAKRRLSKPRIAPLEVNEASTEAAAVLDSQTRRSGRVFNIFRTLAHHPDLARDWLTFGSHILRRNSLVPRDREILILRAGWNCQSEYEWAQHVRIAKDQGLSDDDIRMIATGPTSAHASDRDRLLMQAADELDADAFISDKTWNALSAIYDTKQLLDLVFTVGQYTLVSMALNTLGVQLDKGLLGADE